VVRPNLKVMFFCFVGLILVLVFSSKASAAEQDAVTGRAEILNTGGYLDFSHSKSNVVILSSTNSTKNFSGYVWSDDLGWVDFGAVSVNSTTRIVAGKARIQNTGGYIDFNVSPYHSNVTIGVSGNFSGYVWSEDLGWLNFSGAFSPIGELPETGGIGGALRSLKYPTGFGQNPDNVFLIVLIGSSAIAALASFLIYKRKKNILKGVL